MYIKKLTNIRRLNKIVVTLVRYGFGGLVAEMRLFPLLSTIERIFVSKKKAGLSTPVRVRLVLEELGPTFIKFGQIASTRADILPTEWVEEFKKLQDMVRPFSFEEVRGVVEKELKGSLEEKFSTFDEEPFASASIAQVHFATLNDGTDVAVKVRRPGIARVIEADMSVMHIVAELLQRYVPRARRYRPLEVVDEFTRVITNEQDLTIEGAAIGRFYSIFKSNPNIQIPKVYWDWSTEEVLTMERVYGTPIDEVETLRAKGIDIKKAAIDGLEIFFSQVFEHGIFHADLHPGNIFIRDDGVIIYLDFGIVGRLDRKLRKYLASMLYYIVREDYYRMAIVHRDMGLIGPGVDIGEFEEALRVIIEPILGAKLEHIDISTLLMKLLQTARRFDMRLQPNLLLLQKSMVIIEGVGRQLYPDIDMWEVTKPMVYKWMLKEKLSPKSVAGKASERAEEIAGAALSIPYNMNDFFEKGAGGDLTFGFVPHGIEPVIEEIHSTGKRTSRAVLTGSLVIAGTLSAALSAPDSFAILGVPVLSIVLFAGAILLGIKSLGTHA